MFKITICYRKTNPPQWLREFAQEVAQAVAQPLVYRLGGYTFTHTCHWSGEAPSPAAMVSQLRPPLWCCECLHKPQAMIFIHHRYHKCAQSCNTSTAAWALQVRLAPVASRVGLGWPRTGLGWPRKPVTECSFAYDRMDFQHFCIASRPN